jgi:hypothetical protein
MPQTRKVTEAGELVFVEKQMASGLRVRDITGFRPGFSYEWDYVPASTITALVTMLRTGGFFTVDYFDTDGTNKQGSFSIDYPSLRIFAFRNGVPVWRDCKLTIKAQGVV